jgi:predicted RNase H-like HicB family nuclease
MRCTVVLEQEPSGMVVAHVPALRGCVSQGRNRREALRNVKEAIGLFVETLIENGRPVATESGREVVEVSVVGRRASSRGSFPIARSSRRCEGPESRFIVSEAAISSSCETTPARRSSCPLTALATGMLGDILDGAGLSVGEFVAFR